VPVLGVIVLSTIGLHSLAEHKELRFVLLATVCMPMLVGIGLANLLRRAPLRIRERLGAAVMIGFALTLSAVTAAATYAYATPADAWHRERAVLQATATARAVPGACGLGVRTIWLYGSGGYTWWHRDLPIYYDTWDESKRLDNSTYIRRLDSRLDGRSVPQFSGPALAANAGRFNVLIGRPEDGLPNFTKTVCFGGDGLENKFVCVFTRPGGCD
jgi:hypothetical protein